MGTDIVASVTGELTNKWKAELFADGLKDKRTTFLRFAQAAVENDKALQQCDPMSLVESITKAALMGLAVNDGTEEAHLIAYGKKAKLVIGYQGMMRLARENPEVEDVWAETVYEGDDFSCSAGLHPDLSHTRRFKSLKPEFFYAIAQFKSGRTRFHVMSKAEVDEIKRKAAASNSPAWRDWYDRMGEKTVIRKLCRKLPKPSWLARATAYDELDEQGYHEPPIETSVELDEEYAAVSE